MTDTKRESQSSDVCVFFAEVDLQHLSLVGLLVKKDKRGEKYRLTVFKRIF